MRHNKEWRGYTLDEMMVMKAVNEAKIEFLTERLMQSGKVHKEMGWLDRLPEYFMYFKAGMKLYKTVKTLFSRS